MEDKSQKDQPVEAQSATAKPRPKKRKARTKSKKKRGVSGNGKKGRKVSVPFPTVPFQSSLAIGEAIQTYASGQKARRLTLFEKLEKSPDSGPSRMMITNSGRYGVTKGGYTAEFLELTELGAIATSPEASVSEKLKARFKLSIESIQSFKHLYDKNRGARIPSPEVMRDSLSEIGVAEEHRKECVEIFLENARFLGLLRTLSGAERLLPIEQLIEEQGGETSLAMMPGVAPSASDRQKETVTKKNWKKVCFFIAPIGNEGSEQRKHSDMVLEALITRALEGEGFDVIRADGIVDPGMISGQVIEYLLHSELVIADLSFHNPNVFYELAIRHMTGKPIVHLIRSGDQIPFDVKDFRTILVDTNDKYDLVAKLDIYRAEIATQVRLAVSGAEGSTNPIKTFAKNLVVRFDGGN